MPEAVLSSRWLGPAVVAAAAGGTWIGATNARWGPLLVFGVAGALVVAFVASRLQSALILLLALGATVLPDRWGAVSAGGVQTDAVELLAFLVIGAFVVHGVFGQVRRPRVVWPFLLFQVALVLGLVVGAAHGTDRQGLQGAGKAYALYLLPVVFAGVFATKTDQDRLERALLRICDVGTLVTVAAAVLHLPLGGHLLTTEVQTLDETVTASRIRVPLLALLVLAILLVLGRVLDRGAVRSDVLRLLGYPLPVLLSFNRSTWVPLLGGCLLLGVLRQGKAARARGLQVILVALVLGGVTFAAASSGALGDTSRAAAQRAASAVNPAVTSELSYTDRQKEDRVAQQAIARSPLVGVGVGRPYGARRAIYLDNPPRLVFYDRLFIHNSYLGVWLQFGVLGVLALLTLAVATAREAYAAVRQLPPSQSTRHLAAALSLVVAGGSALFQTSLAHRPTILAMSCAYALLQRPAQEPTPEGLSRSDRGGTPRR